SGSAKVRRSGRRNTRVELEIENLPRAYELGSVYTTYVLWAISPEGRADNLGEIKRGGSLFVNSKIDVTTPLETFALIVTAEPHYLVRAPSRMVVLENLPPREPGEAQVTTVPVSYIGNSSDYFRDQRASRDNAVREAEETAAEASKQIQDLRERLNREESARELAERDSASANQQLRELRAENTRLRDELQTVRSEGDAAKLNLARMEGERAAEQARSDAERKAAQAREALQSLKSSLARFGTVKDTGQGIVLVLSDALWANPRGAELTPKAVATTVDPLAALLANNPDLRLRIEAYADARGDEATLQKLTQDRA